MKARVEFDSALLGAPVAVVIEGDSEPLHYQFGTIGGEYWLESLTLHGVDISTHLSESAAAVLVDEALEALAVPA